MLGDWGPGQDLFEMVAYGVFSKEQFYFLQQLHQLNYSNIDSFININKKIKNKVYNIILILI